VVVAVGYVVLPGGAVVPVGMILLFVSALHERLENSEYDHKTLEGTNKIRATT